MGQLSHLYMTTGKVRALTIWTFVHKVMSLLFSTLSSPDPGTSPVAQTVKNLPAVWKTQVWFLGKEEPLEKGMATHSIILAWRIPWTEGPDRLQSMGHKEMDKTERLTLSLFSPRFVTTFLPRSKHLSISWLQSLAAVILKPKRVKYVTASIFPSSICHEVMGQDAKIYF